jgi:hypothetical protein
MCKSTPMKQSNIYQVFLMYLDREFCRYNSEKLSVDLPSKLIQQSTQSKAKRSFFTRLLLFIFLIIVCMNGSFPLPPKLKMN